MLPLLHEKVRGEESTPKFRVYDWLFEELVDLSSISDASQVFASKANRGRLSLLVDRARQFKEENLNASIQENTPGPLYARGKIDSTEKSWLYAPVD